jgi:hypothetical protein
LMTNPPPDTRLQLGARLIVIGDVDAEERFLQLNANH